MKFRVCLLAAAAGLCLPGSLAAQDETAPDEAVAAVRKTGAQVLQIAQDDERVTVAYHLGKVEVTPELLGSLAGLKEQLYGLNLRGTNVNDQLAAQLAHLTSLVRLHLENTAITDAALSHLAGMQQLEYLNLYGTKITDAGLQHLAKLESLKKVYVWQTAVTLEGVHALQAALPELQVIGGPPEPIIAVEAPRPAPEPTTPEKAKETAKKNPADPKKKEAESKEEKKTEKKEELK